MGAEKFTADFSEGTDSKWGGLVTRSRMARAEAPDATDLKGLKPVAGGKRSATPGIGQKSNAP